MTNDASQPPREHRFNLRTALGMAATFAVWAALVRPVDGDSKPSFLAWVEEIGLPDPSDFLPYESFYTLIMIAAVGVMVYSLVEFVLLFFVRPRSFWLQLGQHIPLQSDKEDTDQGHYKAMAPPRVTDPAVNQFPEHRVIQRHKAQPANR